MEFRLLGDVEVAASDGRLIDIGHARQRSVLVALLLDANRVVFVDDLADRIWDGKPPQRWRETIYGYVSRLRSALTAGGGDGVEIGRQESGYVLTVEPDAIDLNRFRHLAEQVREFHGGDALDVYDRALRLWRGEPFGRLDNAWLAPIRAVLRGERLDVLLNCNDIALRQGMFDRVVTGTRPLMGAHPFDERLTGQLMLALHKSGRTAEALGTYRQLRQRLADELGIDPGRDIQELELSILRGDMVGGYGQPLGPAHPPLAPGSRTSAEEDRDSAVALLDQIMARCADRPQQPGQYRYFARRRPDGSAGDDLTEMWIPLDLFDDWLVVRTGYQREEVLRGPYGGDFLRGMGNWREPTPDFYARLPRDPRDLKEMLYAVYFEPYWDRGVMYSDVPLALTHFPAPADVRTRLFRLLRDELVVRAISNVPTLDRERATAIVIRSMSVSVKGRLELLLDPANGEVLGASYDGRPIVGNRHAIVDELGQRP